MFKEMGQMASLLKNLPKIQTEMKAFQERLPGLNAFGESGGGLVQVEVNGNFELTRLHLNVPVIRPEDKALFEDLIRGATNLALHRMREQIAQEMARITAGLGLPAGAGLPGALGLPGLLG